MGLINFRRAMLACRNSGYEIIDRFADLSKTIEMITLNLTRPIGKRSVMSIFQYK
jgi:hypothetical protein